MEARPSPELLAAISCLVDFQGEYGHLASAGELALALGLRGSVPEHKARKRVLEQLLADTSLAKEWRDENRLRFYEATERAKRLLDPAPLLRPGRRHRSSALAA